MSNVCTHRQADSEMCQRAESKYLHRGPEVRRSIFFFFYIFSVLGVPPQPEVFFTTLESVSKRVRVSWTGTWTLSRSNQNQKSAVAFAHSVYSRTEQTNGSMPSALQSTLTTCSFAPKAAENLAHVACAARHQAAASARCRCGAVRLPSTACWFFFSIIFYNGTLLALF